MEPQANFNGNGRAFKKVVEGVSVFSLHYKGHVCINKRRVKKKKKKSGPRGQRSRPRRDNAHATTVGSAVQKTLRSLRQQRSANLI